MEDLHVRQPLTAMSLEWTKALQRTDRPFLSKRFGIEPSKIIGYTPEKKVQRFVYSRLSRIGSQLNKRLGRFEWDEEGEVESARPWHWVEVVGERSTDAMRRPIYEKRDLPTTVKMTWGFGVPPEEQQ